MFKRVLYFSACLGFVVGVVWRPDWQWSLEVAQIAAGTVTLPANNPLRIFSNHLYAPFLIWPQALLLKAGMSSMSVSILFSGLQSALSFMAVTSVLLVFSENITVALVVPFLFTSVINTIFMGHNYPIFFPTDLNNGGIVGFYATMLGIGLFGLGYVPIAMFLLGLLPSLHPSIAIGVWIGALGYYLISNRVNKKLLMRNLRWFIYGVIFFLITLIIHRFMTMGLVDRPTGTEKQILEYFVSYVDGHRRPRFTGLSWVGRLEFFEPEFFLLAVIGVFFGRYKKFVSSGTKVILKFLAMLSVCAVFMTLLEEIWPENFPLVLKTVMIARWLNFNSIILPLLGLGVLSYKNSFGKMFILIAVFLFGAQGQVLWRWVFVLLFLYMEFKKRNWKIKPFRINTRADGIVTMITVMVCVLTFQRLVRAGFQSGLKQNTLDKELIEKISKGDKLFISSYLALPLPQAMTNRGVLLNLYWADTISYAPSVGDEFEAILQDVYGVSLYDKDIWPNFEKTRAHWEKRTPKEWQDIGVRYEATDVLVPKEWKVRLPKKFESETLVLYHIDTK